MNLSDNITGIKGIGEKKSKLFNKMEISTIRDLLFHFPRTYQKYEEPISSITDEGDTVAIIATVIDKPISRKTKRSTVTVAKAAFLGEQVELVWFGIPYIKNQLLVGLKQVFYGKLTKLGAFTWKMQQPLIFSCEEYKNILDRLLPIYPLSKGISNNTIKKSIESVLEEFDDGECIPRYLLDKYSYISFYDAIKAIHFPKDMDELIVARNRLVYNEFLEFFIQMYTVKNQSNEEVNEFVINSKRLYEKVIKELPFELTDGQKDTLEEIKSDFNAKFISQRLIQGDVGSGKTIVAFLSMLLMVENGYTAALMAPTEVLANQHYASFKEYIEDFDLGFEVVLLTGSMTASEKKQAKDRIKRGGGLFVIGTHALIQNGVVYDNLALVITDEQHRFGVKQRDNFSKKGSNPFVLVMSATPIPRTLALILYGDMNVSLIKDVPKQKLPIKNCVIGENKRNTAYQFIVNEINKGHQAYIICPLVEASEKTEAQNVTEYRDYLEEILPKSINIGILHGKMSASDKTSVMNDFLVNRVQILVSTTVVEVGVNVVNATAIMIENANRFGLAQLHQLRGRVGRGKDQSYCILMDDNKKEPSKRLEILSSSNDGFYIAGEDLKLRGPGDFYGIRQSGDFRFALADIYQDADIMKNAANDAKEIIKADPNLNKKEHTCLKEYINTRLKEGYDNL